MPRRATTLLVLGVLACGLLGWVQQPSLSVQSWSLLDVTAPTHPRHPLNRGLARHWQVLPQTNQAGSTWRNTAPLAAPVLATLVNMLPTSASSGWNRTTRSGGFGEMRFDGINDYVDVGRNGIGSALADASGATVALWVRYTSLPGTDNLVFAAFFGGNGSALRLGFPGGLGGRVALGGRSVYSDGFQSVTTTAAVAAGTWTQLVGVVNYAAATMAVYLNGVLDVETGVTFGGTTYQNSVPDGADVLGANGDNAWEFVGALDDVRVYAQALSAREVAALSGETSTVRNATLQWLPVLVAKTGVVVVPRRLQQY